MADQIEKLRGDIAVAGGKLIRFLTEYWKFKMLPNRSVGRWEEETLRRLRRQEMC